MRITENERKLSPQHSAHLEEHAVDIDLALRLGVYTAETPDDLPAGLVTRGSAVCPAIVFPWAVGGETWYQIKTANGEPKYLFEKDSGDALWIVHDAGRKAKGVLLVEGTKQALAAASLDPDWHVYAMAGCWGWSHNQMPRRALQGIAAKLPLVAILDADLKTNPDVWDAARGLLDEVKIVTKADSVKIARTPGVGTVGLDDYLGEMVKGDPADAEVITRRSEMLEAIVEAATDKIGKRPTKRKVSEDLSEIAMEGKKFSAIHLALHLDRQRPYAVGPDYQTLHRYKESKGVYERQLNMKARLGHDLAEDYERVDVDATMAMLVAVATDNGRVIAKDIEPSPMIAVQNGLLDPDTGELHDPSPDHIITAQWPVIYDPEATCPTILAYLEQRMPGQVDAFLDTACRMLDRDRTAQDRALLLFGPSRSGKSTALGMLSELVGPEGRSSVTLHDLAQSRFAAAQLVGKSLNVANELHHGEVGSSSMFKALTGGDYVMIEEKHEKPYHFRFHGLMAFATNEIPSMAGDSDAVVRRIVPIVCPRSFAGEEDESIKTRLYAELPGLLNELMRRHQAQNMPKPHPTVVGELRSSFDRVHAWWHEATAPAPTKIASMTPVEAYQAFGRWLDANGYSRAMNQRLFIKRLSGLIGGFSLVKGTNRTGLVELSTPPVSEFERLMKLPEFAQLDPEGGGEGCTPHTPFAREKEEKEEEEEVEKKGWREVHPSPPHRWLTLAPASTPAGIAVVFAHLGALDDRLVAIDIETNGLDMADMVVRTVQLGYADGEEYHAHVIQIELPDGTYSAENAAAVVKGLAGSELDLWSYGTFDARAIKAGLGIEVEISDAMPLHHRFNSFEAGMQSPLKQAFKAELAAESAITGDDTRSISTGDPEFLEYAALDAVGLRLLLERWATDDDGFVDRERRLSSIAQSMSDHGLLVDVDAVATRAVDLRQEQADLVGVIERLAPGIKPASPKMVDVIEARGVEVPVVRRKSRKGASTYTKSIGHKALRSDDELVVAVQGWRRISTARTALVGDPTKKTKGGIVHNLDAGGRIHGRFNPLGARTGRWSSSGPNLQNIPKSRRTFFVPAPGFTFVQADLSQIEYRVAAALSKDPAMAKAYHDGLDFHVYAAQILSGVEEPTPEQRQSAKAVGFGMIYGQSAKTGAANAGTTEAEFQKRLDAYDGAFPDFAQWRRSVTAQADFGLTPPNPYGRQFRVPPGAGYMAVNYLCQSTAREVFSDWLIKVADRVERYLVAVVHDEIVLEVPEAEAAEMLDFVIECAAECSIPGSDIPIVATGALAPNNWSEAY